MIGIMFVLSMCFFFFSSRRRHTRSVSAFLLNRSSDLQVTEQSVRFQNGRSLNELNRGQSGLETYGLFSNLTHDFLPRSEERRVGKECITRWTSYHKNKANSDSVRHGFAHPTTWRTE